MSATQVWLVILFGGLVTFGFRFFFLAFGDKFGDAKSIQKILRMVPAAVMAALACSGLFIQKSQTVFDPLDPKLYAALVAGLVAYRFKSLWWTIVSGMCSLYLFQALLP